MVRAKQAERSSRWITVHKPFDYRWPSGAITTWREADLGEHLVKDEVADFAVDGGYATEGKLDGSARSRKGKGRKVRRAAKKEAAPVTATDERPATAVDNEAPADADRPADRPAVDHDAG